jgi:hypothetical protein
MKDKKVLICNNCKDIWIAPKEKCKCGCTTLTKRTRVIINMHKTIMVHNGLAMFSANLKNKNYGIYSKEN